MSTNGYSRVPLQEQTFNDLNAKLTDTPISKFNTKLTTPPDMKELKPAPETELFDPSIMQSNSAYSSSGFTNNYTSGNVHPSQNVNASGSALLSPAFSSPRQYTGTSLPPPQCIDPSSSLSLSDDSELASVKKSTMTKKRAASAAAKKTKKEMKESTFDLDSEQKPPYSYATLIGISILSHADKRLPLSQIYQWISDTFRYYKREDVGWQNSIRHNLSLNKAFVKGEKLKDGKGHFWCIKPGHEEQFLKSRLVKKSSYHEVMDQISSNRLKENTKRSMNAIPLLPNEDTSFKGSLRYDYTYTKDDEDEDDDEIPHKRQRVERVLGDPFVQRTPQLTPTLNVPSLNTPHLALHIKTESPNKPLLSGKNLTYTSSFSCKSNLELSPIRSNETGPLLEPLTPANNQVLNLSHLSSNHHLHISLHPVLSQYKPALPANTPNMLRTPKSNRTPMRNLKTPQSNSVMKKLWNSPLYLEDFYYSPLINNVSVNSQNHGVLTSYDDDDMVIRSFEHHPQQHQSPVVRKITESTLFRIESLNEPLDLASRMSSATDED